MPVRNVNLTLQLDQYIETGVAAREGFDSIDRGDGLAFASMDDLEAWVHRVGEAVSNEIASRRERA